MKNERAFEGIWIPKEIWLSTDLTLQEKVFYVEIKSLDNENGCFANNQYFADFFGVSKVRVSEVINSLVEKGYVQSTVDQANGNKRILKTLLKESLRPSQTFLYDPLKDSFKHNNIINNTKNKDSIDEIFNFWTQTMKKASDTKFTVKRRNRIRDRLKEGYTIERIKNAIVGCSLSPFHQGQNDTHTKYNDIELICRSGEKLEFFEQKSLPQESSLSQEEIDGRAAVRASMEALNGR